MANLGQFGVQPLDLCPEKTVRALMELSFVNECGVLVGFLLRRRLDLLRHLHQHDLDIVFAVVRDVPREPKGLGDGRVSADGVEYLAGFAPRLGSSRWGGSGEFGVGGHENSPMMRS